MAERSDGIDKITNILKEMLTPDQIKKFWGLTEEERDIMVLRGVASLIVDTPYYLERIDKTLKDIDEKLADIKKGG